MIPPESTLIEENAQNNMQRLCRTVSYVFHPFAIPVYVMLVLLFADTVPARLTLNIKYYLLAVVTLTTVIIPMGFVILMRILGVIQDYSLATRRERIVPLIIIAMSYVLCLVMLRGIGPVFLVNKFLYAATACVIAALVITIFWQVSLHMIAMSGALAMLVLISISGLANISAIVVLWIVATGALASARLYLGKHTPPQVWVGFLTGALVSSLIILNIA